MRIDGVEITIGAVIGAVLAYYLVSHKLKTGAWV